MIPAAEVVTLEDELAACLQRASRLDLDSPSNRQLRVLLRTPRLLDYLEQLVMADRERRLAHQVAEDNPQDRQQRGQHHQPAVEPRDRPL